MPPGTTGALIFVGLGLGSLLALFTPLRSLPDRERQRRRRLAHSVLADLDRATRDGPPMTHWELAIATRRKPAQVLRALATLRRAGLVERDGDRVYPSSVGRAAAQSVAEPAHGRRAPEADGRRTWAR